MLHVSSAICVPWKVAAHVEHFKSVNLLGYRMVRMLPVYVDRNVAHWVLEQSLVFCALLMNESRSRCVFSDMTFWPAVEPSWAAPPPAPPPPPPLPGQGPPMPAAAIGEPLPQSHRQPHKICSRRHRRYRPAITCLSVGVRMGHFWWWVIIVILGGGFVLNQPI